MTITPNQEMLDKMLVDEYGRYYFNVNGENGVKYPFHAVDIKSLIMQDAGGDEEKFYKETGVGQFIAEQQELFGDIETIAGTNPAFGMIVVSTNFATGDYH